MVVEANASDWYSSSVMYADAVNGNSSSNLEFMYYLPLLSVEAHRILSRV